MYCSLHHITEMHIYPAKKTVTDVLQMFYSGLAISFPSKLTGGMLHARRWRRCQLIWWRLWRRITAATCDGHGACRTHRCRSAETKQYHLTCSLSFAAFHNGTKPCYRIAYCRQWCDGWGHFRWCKRQLNGAGREGGKYKYICWSLIAHAK